MQQPLDRELLGHTVDQQHAVVLLRGAGKQDSAFLVDKDDRPCFLVDELILPAEGNFAGTYVFHPFPAGPGRVRLEGRCALMGGGSSSSRRRAQTNTHAAAANAAYMHLPAAAHTAHSCVFASPQNDEVLMVASENASTHAVLIHDISSGSLVQTLVGLRSKTTFIHSFRLVSPHPRVWVVAVAHDNTVIIWDVETAAVVASRNDFQSHVVHVASVSNVPNGHRLVLTLKDGNLSLWTVVGPVHDSVVAGEGHTNEPENKVCSAESKAVTVKYHNRDLSSEHIQDNMKVILSWVNYYLARLDLQVDALDSNMEDGFFFILLIGAVTGKHIEGYRPRSVLDQKIEIVEWVHENQLLVRNWLKENDIERRLTSSQIDTSPFQDLYMNIVRTLVWVSSGISHKEQVDETSLNNLEHTEKLVNQMGIRYPIKESFGNTQSMSLFLLATIFKDKVDSAKNPEVKKTRKWIAPPQRFKTPKPLDPIIFEQRVLRIFLSSTFRDMQYERDRFFQHGAVELKSLAKSKGLELVFIDLRWGLTAEDSNDGWVVIRCCDSIKKCPYFVCFLGARYGWVPDQSDPKQYHPETNKRFPFLVEIPGLSVTEYEIQFAALIDKPACSRAFFFFRDEQFAVSHAKDVAEAKLFQAESENSRERQCALKSKIQQQYGAITYHGPEEFSNLVASHVSHSIYEDFPEQQVREPEDQAQLQFKQHRLAGFEGRSELLKEIVRGVQSQFGNDETQITILAAESGIGKSSLMAATVRDLEAAGHMNAHICYHFVGCTSLSNYVESICVRFWQFVVKTGCLGDSAKTESDFRKEGINGLFKAMTDRNLKEKFIFLIDAVNQIHPSQDTPVPHLLTWLPKKCPPNVAVVVSTIDTHPSCKVIMESNLRIIPVSKLTPNEIQQATESFLGRYDKKLNEQQIGMILDNMEQTGHPLYLRLVLEEIRVFGVYELLDREIMILLMTSGVIELYNMIITRWESKFNTKGTPLVSTAMKVLYVTRIGLSEGELDKYLQQQIGFGFNLAEWKSFFFTLAESLFVRNGRYMYFHQLLLETTRLRFFDMPRAAVETRREYGMWLFGQYAEDEDADEELIAEICHQLLEANSYDTLIEFLKKDHVVTKMLIGRYRYEFFGCWRAINASEIANYKDVYSSMSKKLNKTGDLLVEFFLEAYENSFLVSVLLQRISKRTSEESKMNDYLNLGRVYKNLQRWNEATASLQKCFDILEFSPSDDNTLLSMLHDEIGEIDQKQNRFEKALCSFTDSLDIRTKIYGDMNLFVSKSYDLIGLNLLAQSRHEEAQKNFQMSKEIRSKLLSDDHPLISTSFNNTGHYYMAIKRFEDALAQFDQSLKILKKSFGDSHPSVAVVTEYIGDVHETLGSMNLALDTYASALSIFISTMGENSPNVVSILEKIGQISQKEKNYRKSFEVYTKTLEIRKRVLGRDHPSVATSLESIARVNYELKRYDQIADCIREAAKIRKTSHTEWTLSLAELLHIGDTLRGLNEFTSLIPLCQYLCLIYFRKFSFENLQAWYICESLDRYLQENNQHHEALDFWIEMRDLYSTHLGRIHDRVLMACEYISVHSNKIGLMKEPVEFTGVRDLIKEALPDVKVDIDWNRDQITSYLLKIVYASKSDESMRTLASDAITLLNFMGVSFSGMDLSGIKIPSANLSNAVFDETNFTNSDLSGVNFTNSFFGSCLLDSSNMENIRLGPPNILFENPNNTITSVCYVPGKLGRGKIVYSLKHYRLYVVDFVSGASLKELKGHERSVNCVCRVESDEARELIASASDDKTVRIWDLESGKCLQILEGHEREVTCVIFLLGPDNQKWVASGSSDCTIMIWDLSTGAQVKMFEGHSNHIRGICYVKGPNEENWLASCSSDKTIRIWDLESGGQVRKLQGHTDTVNTICSLKNSDGQVWLASGSNDKSIRVWNLATGAQVLWAKDQPDGITTLCHIRGLHGENWLASGSGDKLVRVWELDMLNPIRVLKGHQQDITSICNIEGPNGEKWIASASKDKTIRVWDFVSTHIKSVDKTNAVVNYLHSFSGPKGVKCLAFGGLDHFVTVVDLETGSNIWVLRGHTDYVNCVCSIVTSDGCHWLASGADDNSIRIWDMKTGKQIRLLTGHENDVSKLCSVRDVENGMLIVSGSKDKTIRLWNVDTGEQLYCFEHHQNEVTSLEIIHDEERGPLILSGCSRSAIISDLKGKIIKKVGITSLSTALYCYISRPQGKVWMAYKKKGVDICIQDMESGDELKTLEGHTSGITSLIKIDGPNGESYLASSSNDKDIRIWDVNTGSIIKVLRGHTSYVKSLSTIRGPKKENWLISGGWDKVIYVWDLNQLQSPPQPGSFPRETLKDRSPLPILHVLGERFLCVRNTSMRDVKGMSEIVKQTLFYKGAASSGANFANFCENNPFTSFQASSLAESYESGTGLERDPQKALYWFHLGCNYSRLQDMCREGVPNAFSKLMSLAESQTMVMDSMKQGIASKLNHPVAAALAIECLENGWGVEMSVEKMCESLLLLHCMTNPGSSFSTIAFEKIKQLLYTGSEECWMLVKKRSEKVIPTNPTTPWASASESAPSPSFVYPLLASLVQELSPRFERDSQPPATPQTSSA